MTSPYERDSLSPVALVRSFQRQADALPPSPARSLRDWLADPRLLEPPEIVIPHLAVEGRVSLLSGREKIGKSTLAACVVASASRGDDVLGVPLVQSDTCLWYALDEPVADTVRRFDVLGADIDEIIINDLPRTAAELLSALEKDLAGNPEVDVVVVDNLSRVFAMSGVDPNSSREAEPVLARIVDVFHQLNVSAVLLYHTGKGGREYRGSTAIGATVDEVLTLRKRGLAEEDDFDDDAADDGRRLLVQEGRNLRGRVHLTCIAGVYRLYEETSVPRERILETLRDHGTVVGRAELVKQAGVRKAVGLKTIGELIGSGHIAESGRQLKLGSASSTQFPILGTSLEPMREPSSDVGSHSRNPHPAETGTSKPRGHFQPSENGPLWVEEVA
jgi:hypothetical protein